MLIHLTLDQLQALGLQGMAKALTELDKHGDAATLSHAEWLALLLDRKTIWRHDNRLSARLPYAKSSESADRSGIVTAVRDEGSSPAREVLSARCTDSRLPC